MKYAVVIVSRNRPEMLYKTLPVWQRQGLPVFVFTEPGQTAVYAAAASEYKNVTVKGHRLPDRGVGYARMASTDYMFRQGFDAFIMADDDTVPAKGNVRVMLDFVARRKGLCCAGWMPQYGLWLKNGNEIAKDPDYVIPRGASPDRCFAVNSVLAIQAGNFDHRLRALDTQELNRRGIASGYMWWVHTGVHLKNMLPPHAPGGIDSHVKTQGLTRQEMMYADQKIIYADWPDFVAPPGKRMSTRWLKMAREYIGPKAVAALKATEPFRPADVKPRPFHR